MGGLFGGGDSPPPPPAPPQMPDLSGLFEGLLGAFGGLAEALASQQPQAPQLPDRPEVRRNEEIDFSDRISQLQERSRADFDEKNRKRKSAAKSVNTSGLLDDEEAETTSASLLAG